MKLIIDIPNEGYDWIKNGFPDNEDKEFLIKAVKNGIPYEERSQGEWIVTGEEQGAFGITYKIRKCDKCGWERGLVIPDNFCPNCGAKMQRGGTV